MPHSGGVALAMLAILPERGGYRGRVAEALLTRYDLLGQAVVFFRFLAGPPGLAGQAASVAGAIDLLVDERGLSGAAPRCDACAQPARTAEKTADR